jgi:hypothetical protein
MRRPPSLRLTSALPALALLFIGCSTGDGAPEGGRDAGAEPPTDAGACAPSDLTRRCRPDCYDNPFGVFDCDDELDAGPEDPCLAPHVFWDELDGGSACPEASDEVCDGHMAVIHAFFTDAAADHDACAVDADCVRLSPTYFCDATSTMIHSCGVAVAAANTCAFHADIEGRLSEVCGDCAGMGCSAIPDCILTVAECNDGHCQLRQEE